VDERDEGLMNPHPGGNSVPKVYFPNFQHVDSHIDKGCKELKNELTPTGILQNISI
jgi:hypothetical protein